jgi:CMP-N,N'-diacetyllegionaminic acid synthase
VNNKIVAIIPARGGSKRIKNKNIKLFNSKPLIFWTIDAALKSKKIDDVYVSSENKNILKISKKFGANVVKRPIKLSNNIIMPDMAIRDAYLQINKNYKYVVSLQPTSPLRTADEIDGSVNKIIKTKADSLLSCFKAHSFIWKKNKNFFSPQNYNHEQRPRSQDMKQFQENGAIYITKPAILIKKHNRLGGKISIFEMSFWNSIDIDNIEDFKIAELIKKNVQKTINNC